MKNIKFSFLVLSLVLISCETEPPGSYDIESPTTTITDVDKGMDESYHVTDEFKNSYSPIQTPINVTSTFGLSGTKWKITKLLRHGLKWTYPDYEIEFIDNLKYKLVADGQTYYGGYFLYPTVFGYTLTLRDFIVFGVGMSYSSIEKISPQAIKSGIFNELEFKNDDSSVETVKATFIKQ